MRVTEDKMIDALEGYKLVYQGGHHNVYCNGTTHRTTNGGWTGLTEPTRFTSMSFRCDCEYWKKKCE